MSTIYGSNGLILGFNGIITIVVGNMSFSSGIFLVLYTLVVGTLAVPPTENILLSQVIQIVEKTLNFFAEDYSAINVDGLFGLRLGQGQLNEAVRECEERACDRWLVQKLGHLESRLNEAGDSALPYLEAGDPEYFNRFHATIDQPYVMPYKSASFGGNTTQMGSNANYDEEHGDACYGRMLGTYEENGKVLPRCNITHDCWDYMTQGNTKSYFITHQLLYFIFIEHVGCTEAVEHFVQTKKLRDVQEDFCRKIYEESKYLSNTGDVTPYRKDLFLEQAVLCGPLGFEDFMRPDWISMVLSWPDKRLGCFKRKPIPFLDDLDLTRRKRNVDMNAMESENSSTMRKLLREKQMKEGCLSHTSGLGFGVLCTYLRFLIRDLYLPLVQ